MNDGTTCPHGCGQTLAELARGAPHGRDCPSTGTARLRAGVEAVLFGGEVPPGVDVTWLQTIADRIGKRLADMTMNLREQLQNENAALHSAAGEIRAAWEVLGTTVEEAADDPDTARLADSIRVSLQHERDERDRLRALIDVRGMTTALKTVDAHREKVRAPRLGVVPLVAVAERLVLGKRRNGVHAGKWILPGGGVEFRELLHDAGAREYLEETGMRIEIRADENPITTMQIIGRETHRVCLVMPAKALDPLSALRPSDELSEVRGFTLDELDGIADEMTAPVRGCLERLGFLRKRVTLPPAGPTVRAVAVVDDGSGVTVTPDPHDDCIACEGQPDDERCAQSQRPCGHHCNHSWALGPCCWCGAEFKPETV